MKKRKEEFLERREKVKGNMSDSIRKSINDGVVFVGVLILGWIAIELREIRVLVNQNGKIAAINTQKYNSHDHRITSMEKYLRDINLRVNDHVVNAAKFQNKGGG